jgi:hypothetical protein
VELGLKACAAKLFSAEAIPDKKLVISLHTHDLNALIGLAGLKGDLKARQDQDGNFAASWGITSEWTPEARYEATDKSSAHFLVNAIAHPEYGVLSWIRTYW